MLFFGVGIERRKQLYRRERGTDVWHLRPQCPEWPLCNYVERLLPGAGRVCSECLESLAYKIPSRRKRDLKKKR